MGQWKQADLGDVSPLFAQRFRSGMWEFTGMSCAICSGAMALASVTCARAVQ